MLILPSKDMPKLSAPLKLIDSANFKEKGFSLVEIILIIMIVGFIVSLINLLPSSIGLVGTSKNETLAKDVAQTKIEDLRALTYVNLANTNNPAPIIIDPRLASIPEGSGSYIVEDCIPPTCSGEEIKKVTVTVSWVDSGNKLKDIQFSTFIAKGGLN